MEQSDQQALFKPHCPRVLVVENDPEWRHDHLINLEQWGYQAVLAQGEGMDLLMDARQKARDYRCHLALVDMRLFDHYDPDDYSGLELIPELLPTQSIVVSGSVGWRPPLIAIKEKGALSYIAKAEAFIRLRPEMDDAAHRLCACRHPAQIKWRNIPTSFFFAWFSEKEGPVPEDEADDLMVQLFPKAERLDINILQGDQSDLSSVPRPRSLILKVTEDSRQPVIVKLARKERIGQEIQNYRDHIEGHMGNAYYSHLQQRPVLLWDIGGAIYEFVGQPQNTQRLYYFYKTKNWRHLQECLQRFFCGTWSAHYKGIEVNKQTTLFDIYCRVWKRDWYERLYQHVQSGKFDQTLPSWSNYQSLGAPDPVRWLIRRIQSDTAGYFPHIRTSVTHGDLHADNLLVDTEHNIAWVIDFERTGPGHVLQDFIELEFDIINRLVGLAADEYSFFYQLCIFVSQPSLLGEMKSIQVDNPNVKFVLKVISHLRKLAHQQTGLEVSEEYLWGLLFNALFRARLLIDRNYVGHELYRALMLASILCYRLDLAEQGFPQVESWPPSNWPGVKWEVQPGGMRRAGSKLSLGNLRKILARFHAFKSDAHLRSVCMVDELSYLRRGSYGSNPKERVDWVVSRLSQDSPDGGLLIRFLQELVECCDEDIEPRQELVDFIIRIISKGSPEVMKSI